ncbi:hypothetical protein ABT093_09895 [Kitasatospora sp. NPDC002551]|uniref:hypothetical protein n=1 Tax=Kitasatospora sp. NPDC002551 TaxID=3154539 RepID=UPI00332A0E2F
MSTQPQPLDLDAIQARYDLYANLHAANDGRFINCPSQDSAEDVPALIARVRQLEAAIAAVRALDPGEDYDQRYKRYEQLDPDQYGETVGYDKAIDKAVRTLDNALNPHT